ncbi:MAG: hypothetical protein LBM27_06590 [Lactobacillaceae bacterium]|jgi:sugar phosphate isomerase/epimerase|nr:hypothetical protein [Lactobacillaceae bacterium]
MTLQHYALNTIAFKNLMDAGTPQVDLIQKTKDLGFNTIEIRNEFLTDDPDEFSEIGTAAKNAGIEVFFSVNDQVIENGEINPKIAEYIKQMREMGSDFLKMNVGDFSTFDGNWDLLAQLYDGSFHFNVENNQTLSHASIKNISDFLSQVNEQGIPMTFAFDIANWAFVSEDVEKAVPVFEKYTTYLHLKNYAQNREALSVTSLEEGLLDWRQIAKEFTNITDMALEYPNASDDQLVTDLGNVVSLL